MMFIFQVRLSELDVFNVLFNSINITSEVSSIKDFFSMEDIRITRETLNSLFFEFPNEISLTITENSGMLGISSSISARFSGMTKGLMGNLNGNPMDDFMFYNGTMLPFEATGREIHLFGQSCKQTQLVLCTLTIQYNELSVILAVGGSRNYLYSYVSHSGETLPDESLFTYSEGITHSYYSHPDYVPSFIDEVLSNASQNDHIIACDGDRECIFDATQTGVVDVGLATKNTIETNIANQIQLCE